MSSLTVMSELFGAEFRRPVTHLAFVCGVQCVSRAF